MTRPRGIVILEESHARPLLEKSRKSSKSPLAGFVDPASEGRIINEAKASNKKF